MKFLSDADIALYSYVGIQIINTSGAEHNIADTISVSTIPIVFDSKRGATAREYIGRNIIAGYTIYRTAQGCPVTTNFHAIQTHLKGNIESTKMINQMTDNAIIRINSIKNESRFFTILKGRTTAIYMSISAQTLGIQTESYRCAENKSQQKLV